MNDQKNTFRNDLFKNLISPLIIGISLMVFPFILSNRFIKSKKEIIMGFTAHPSFESDRYENLLNKKISTPANNLLGNLSERYEFKVSIRGKNSYDEIFESLYLDRIDIGFFSPFAYIESYLLEDFRLNNFTCIGQKYMPYGKYYYSGIVVPKKWTNNIGYSSYSKLEKNNISIRDTLLKKNINYILNQKENSTSTRIIPEIVIERKKFNPKNESIYLCRQDYLDLLSRSDTSGDSVYNIGFLASEDWIDACSQDSNLCKKYSFIYFDEYPIPYDPVFINKKKFNRKDKKCFFKLLRQWVYIPENLKLYNKQHRWISDNQDFIRLVLSGKIDDSTKVKKGDTLTISFLDNKLQNALIDTLCKKNDSCIVKLYNREENKKGKENMMKYEYGFNKEEMLSCTIISFKKNEKRKRIELKVVLHNNINCDMKERYVIIPELTANKW